MTAESHTTPKETFPLIYLFVLGLALVESLKSFFNALPSDSAIPEISGEQNLIAFNTIAFVFAVTSALYVASYYVRIKLFEHNARFSEKNHVLVRFIEYIFRLGITMILISKILLWDSLVNIFNFTSIITALIFLWHCSLFLRKPASSADQPSRMIVVAALALTIIGWWCSRQVQPNGAILEGALVFFFVIVVGIAIQVFSIVRLAQQHPEAAQGAKSYATQW